MPRILVFGGTGFLGRHCVDALRRRQQTAVGTDEPDYDVVAASRSPSSSAADGHLVCDLCHGSDESLRLALDGVDLVVNLVGVKTPTASQSWEDAHVRAVRRLLAAMEEGGVTRLVHVTVAGLSPTHRDPYSVTKLASEAAVKEAAAASEQRSSPLSAYIIRPSVVWGRGDDFSRNLAAGILHAPAFPTPAPSGRMAVVHVEDVADCVAAAAAQLLCEGEEEDHNKNDDDDEKESGRGRGSVRCADVCGPEALTLPELLARTAEALDLWCVSVPIPAPLMVPAAYIVEKLMTDPPITTAQLGLLRRGVGGDLAQTTALLGREPRPYTPDGCREAVAGLARPLFGLSVRPLLGQEVRPLLRP